MNNHNTRPIAIYLPQFHPVKENNEWWGEGFTEWTNVTKAKPLFEGHYQPHLPADLGFYDLRVPETRQQQVDMAKEYGIYGFCYYHYWFSGRRILERPFQEVFESGKPDFPFMLCWANETWARTWTGQPTEILLNQQYSAQDDLEHIQYLIPYFKDERYIKVDGKPVIAIYNTVSIPDVASTVKIWRQEAKKQGIDLYICRFESLDGTGKQLMEAAGFDAAIDFQPFGMVMQNYKKRVEHAKTNGFAKQLRFKTLKKISRFWPKPYHKFWNEGRRRFSYPDYAAFAEQLPFPDYKWYPCITPGWDNTARKGAGSFLLHNSTPESYFKWFKSILRKFKPYSKNENFVFINAWNEWAEGNHLEPCQKWGKAYLEKTKQALDEATDIN